MGNLNERFDNKQAIIDKQLKRVLELEWVPANSAYQLRKFHDLSKEYLMLKNISGFVLIHVLKSKLDTFTRTLFQQHIKDNAANENPEKFFEFLHKRCRVMESVEFGQSNENEPKKSNFKDKVKEQVCGCCGKNHAIYSCEKFKSMKVNERSEMVTSKSLCILCLRPNHRVAECSYKSMCPTCGKKHNGLLHFEKNNDVKNVKKAFIAVGGEDVQDEKAQVNTYSVEASVDKTSTLLATALVRVKTSYGW